MFNLFISMYQAQVKNVGTFPISPIVKKIYGLVVFASLMMLIGYWFDKSWVTIVSSIALLILSFVFSFVEKNQREKVSFDKLLTMKKDRLHSLEAVVKKCSLWSEQGIRWLEDGCIKAQEDYSKKKDNIVQNTIYQAFIGLLLVIVQEIPSVFGIFVSEYETAQLIELTEYLKTIIIVCTIPIVVILLVKAWMWCTQVDYSMIQDELGYLRLIRFEQSKTQK